MSLRDELIQVAAVCCAIVEDMELGATGSDGVPYQGVANLAIAAERQRQEAKWGPQHHAPVEWLMILLEEVGEAFEAVDTPNVPEWPNDGLPHPEWRHAHDLWESVTNVRNEGQYARDWCREHDWPDPKHRAIYQGGV